MSSTGAVKGDPTSIEETGDDFVDSFQIPARWTAVGVEHARRVTDRRRGIRNALEVESWRRVREIGRGGFGNVYLEEKTEKGQLRAVKEVPKSAGQARTVDHLREILAMALFSREEALFVKLEGWYQSPQHIFIAMEYFPSGDLSHCVKQALPESDVQMIVFQVAEALEFMHQKGVTHRDIKPSNVFVVSTKPYWVKLGDFGVSKRVKNGSTSLHTSIETDYTAPEIRGFIPVKDGASCYTSAVDLWSLGCLCHWLLTLGLPLTRKEMLPFCRAERALPITLLSRNGASRPAVDFIKSLLRPQPIERLTATQVKESGWPSEPEFNSGTSADNYPDLSDRSPLDEPCASVTVPREEDLRGNQYDRSNITPTLSDWRNVRLTLISATDLPMPNLMSNFYSVYADIKIRGREMAKGLRTKAVAKTKNPTWHETFNLGMPVWGLDIIIKQKIRGSTIDPSGYGDTWIGRAKISFDSEIEEDVVYNERIFHPDKDRKVGKLRYKLKLCPHWNMGETFGTHKTVEYVTTTGLPKGWERCKDSRGRSVYINDLRCDMQLNPPAVFSSAFNDKLGNGGRMLRLE